MSTRLRRQIPISLVLSLPLLGCSGATDAERDVGESRVWKVGVERQLPPFAFVEGTKVEGFAVDLIEAIAASEGYSVRFYPGEAEDLRRSLEAGEIDVIPHLPSSIALEQRFLLSLPHTLLDDGIFVRDDRRMPLPDNRTLDDLLIGRRVLALADDPGLDFVRDRAGEVLIRDSPAEALRSLALGEGECALLPRRIAAALIDSLGLDNIQQLPGRVTSYSRSLSFAVGVEDQELLEKIDEGLEIVTRTRRYLEIYNRWERWRREPVWPRVLLWALAPLAVLSIWAWSLKRTVAVRTAELKAEMAQRRQLELRMEQSRKMESLGVLAGGIAHDFNNLLMGVLGNASLALRMVPEDSPVHGRLEEIRTAGRRAKELTGQMLAYSGRGQFVVERVDLPQLIRRQESVYRGAVHDRIQLEIVTVGDVPAIEGDVGQLNQVLTRLVENASEALEDQVGTITLRTSSRAMEEDAIRSLYLGESLDAGLYVVLEVEDDGVGMDEETRERIFEPFFSTKFTGRGLGLAATLGIVRGHKGAIEVESRPGHGTVLRVYLPAGEQGMPAAVAAGSAQELTAEIP